MTFAKWQPFCQDLNVFQITPVEEWINQIVPELDVFPGPEMMHVVKNLYKSIL